VIGERRARLRQIDQLPGAAGLALIGGHHVEIQPGDPPATLHIGSCSPARQSAGHLRRQMKRMPRGRRQAAVRISRQALRRLDQRGGAEPLSCAPGCGWTRWLTSNTSCSDSPLPGMKPSTTSKRPGRTGWQSSPARAALCHQPEGAQLLPCRGLTAKPQPSGCTWPATEGGDCRASADRARCGRRPSSRRTECRLRRDAEPRYSCTLATGALVSTSLPATSTL